MQKETAIYHPFSVEGQINLAIQGIAMKAMNISIIQVSQVLNFPVLIDRFQRND